MNDVKKNLQHFFFNVILCCIQEFFQGFVNCNLTIANIYCNCKLISHFINLFNRAHYIFEGLKKIKINQI